MIPLLVVFHKDRPTLQMSGPFVDEETFGYFEQRWTDYKTLTGVTIANANLHLRNCLPDEVGKFLYSRYGDAVKTQTEAVRRGVAQINFIR